MFILVNTNWLKSQTIINLVIEETHILNNIPSPKGITWDGSNFWVIDNYTYSLNKLSSNFESIDTTLYLGAKDYGDLTFDGQNFAIVDNSNHQVIKINKNNPLEINIFDLPIDRLITGITWEEPNFYISFEAGWSSQIAKLEPEMDSVSFVAFTMGTVTGLASDNNSFFYCSQKSDPKKGLIVTVKPDHIETIMYSPPEEIKFPTGIEFVSDSFWLLDFENKVLYKLKEDTTTSSKEDVLKTTGYILFQNYPNPFNPLTIIRYKIKNAGNVTLKIFDLLSREIAILVDEYQNAGDYKIGLNIDQLGLTSGIYFYTLNAGDYSEVKKMLLLK